MKVTLRALAFAICLPVAASWQTAAAADAVAAFERFFSSVNALRGEFTQVARDDSGNVLEESSGTMAIQRPSRFRWTYEAPFEQLIVADGEDLWVYDVPLEQVSVRPMDEMLAAGPALLLSGEYESLKRDFEIRPGDDAGWVRLKAREGDWQFESVRVLMEDGMPKRLELKDSLGQVTVLTLNELETNPTLDPALFKFQPPEGVDVVGRGGAGA